jgi:hypothetical protein
LPIPHELSCVIVNLSQSVAKRLGQAMVAACLALISDVVCGQEAATAESAVLERSEPLPRRQSGRAHPDERLSEALNAAKAAWPGMIEGNKLDVEKYNTALARILSSMQERRFAESDVPGLGGSFGLTIERESTEWLDPSVANLMTLAADVRTTELDRARRRRAWACPWFSATIEVRPFSGTSQGSRGSAFPCP